MLSPFVSQYDSFNIMSKMLPINIQVVPISCFMQLAQFRSSALDRFKVIRSLKKLMNKVKPYIKKIHPQTVRNAILIVFFPTLSIKKLKNLKSFDHYRGKKKRRELIAKILKKKGRSSPSRIK